MNIASHTRLAFTATTHSPEDTMRLGQRIGSLLEPGDVIALFGSLGSGKTTLVKGIGLGLGMKDSREVRSASFLIIAEYKARIPIYHFDAYRLDGPEDMYNLGCDELFWGDGVSIVEWADRVEGSLPEEYLEVSLSIESPNSRRVEVSSHGKRYERIVRGLEGKGP
ncbi:MAG TPA: tRNA (adenosine(37)-N6)-threonylcarbamoyltransferase complex ATPase subunit type 1 TsaE [Candidatus Hypogeohydataceae bacterium YC38]|nr:tRNA (adenosine(37)-N6)-threonylcarbamoyltransferase complex ATPase subunit type 1 TsaE [Candidatus Brocadiales bacterium]